MAQAWSQVEQSQQYQQLKPEEQQAAKQQYFSDVVSQKPEFQALPDQEKQAASSQFIGTPIKDIREGKFIPQFTKGLYDTVPFGKRVISMMPNADQIKQNMESTPNPVGVKANIGRAVGEMTGALPAITTGEGIVPEVATATTKLAAGSLGFGANVAGQQSSEGKSIPQAALTGAEAAGSAFVGGKVLEKAGDVIGAAMKPASERISDTIGDLYNKAVKPTIVRGNSNILQKANANVESGIRSIINNKDLSLGDEGVKIPETLAHTSQAIADTKDKVFNQYNDMQKQATGQGVTLDPEALAKPLDEIINNKAMQVVSPKTVSYAKAVKERLIGRDPVISDSGEVIDPGHEGIGPLTPEEAQEMIKGYNGRLKAFYKNPSPDEYSNTAVDALIANNARKQLDDAITGAAGEGYQGLKNQYGALSSMEKDVSRATQRAGNYQSKGLLDFTDVYTGEQLARGILTGNIPEAISGFVGRSIKEMYKKMNSPDANIKNMFSKVSDLMEQEGQPTLAEHVSNVVNTAKEKLGGLADAIPSRVNLGMAGKAGYKAPVRSGGEVEGEIVSGPGVKRISAPQKPITRQDRLLPNPQEAGQASGPTIPLGPDKPSTPDPNGFLAEARQRLADNGKAIPIAVAGATAALGASNANAMGKPPINKDYDFLDQFEGGKQIVKGKLISNGGVQQDTLNEYNKANGKNLKIDNLDKSQVRDIRVWYLGRQGYNNLGEATRKVMADYAYHFGINRANKDLQRLVGEKIDGKIGHKTIEKATKMDDLELANKLIKEQASYMKLKSNYARNANGWNNRLSSLKQMINNGVSI